jgi:hypothetical protein
MLIEATLLGIGVLVWKKLGQGHEWTPEHEEMYAAALEDLKGEAGVAKLREIAAQCEKNGHHVKAFALRRRADLRDTPAKVKKERHEVFRRAMRSTNIEAMLKVAAGFESITATQAASEIRQRVEWLQAQQDRVVPDAPEAQAPPPAEPTQEVRVAEQAPPAPEQAPPAEQAPAPLQAQVEPEPQQEAPTPPPAAKTRVASRPRARAEGDLQQVRAAARTTPAPPPDVLDVEGVAAPDVPLLNGVNHDEDQEGASAQS